MGFAQIPAAVAKTRYMTTLTSGTSWTVPVGITYVNVTLYGAGGGGGGAIAAVQSYQTAAMDGAPGQVITSTLSTTPGASITYAIGAGGTAGASGGGAGGTGGTTTFTGATSATGGTGGLGTNGNGPVGTQAGAQFNGGRGASSAGTATPFAGGTGGAGKIDVEYWA